MRTTQFIGLNEPAIKYLEKNATHEYHFPSHYTIGMFDERIQLRTWLTDEYILTEKVQIEVWSSGPVILTHLDVTANNGADLGFFFSWIQNPEIRGREVDLEKGYYYI